MSNRLFGLLDMSIVGLAAIGFLVWQLVSIRRELRRDKPESPDGSPKRPGHPVGEHRLDDR